MSSTDLRSDLDQAFTLAAYVLGSRSDALEVVRFAVDSVPIGAESVRSEELLRLVRDIIARRGTRARPVTETLPAVWSGEETRNLPPDLADDPARTAALAGAMRRVCFTAVLHSIAETPRCAFVLRHVMGLSDETVSRILRTHAGNLATLRARARQPLEHRLGPHCEHFDPGNPCSCQGRLGLALAEGSLRETDVDPATDPAPTCTGELERLYRTLPKYTLTDDEAEPLLALLRGPASNR
ncbi:hypothetical protein [Nannocystis punicea]|uniref:Uncharacterized protein n=1 Tax=Nannocystis punicea TaxID=2995304 RepID=A0ABY7H5I3_9BACT|nr:hypothetical protein [Nannocystis poenicansa]WAS94526.1 hypothetical protein O0S08_00050 [Nannocystis poenicansa]